MKLNEEIAAARTYERSVSEERAFTRGANWSSTWLNEKLHKFLDMAFYDDPVFGGVCGKFPNKEKMIEFADEYMGQ